MQLIFNSIDNLINKEFKDKTIKNKALHFCSYLTNETIKLINRDENPNNFHQFSSDRFRKLYGGNYKKEFLNKLIALDVIVKNGSYSNNALNSLKETFTQSYAIHTEHQTKAIPVDIVDKKLSRERIKYFQEMYRKMNRNNITKEMLKNLRMVEFPEYEGGIDSLYDELKSVHNCDNKLNQVWCSYIEPYHRFIEDEIIITRDSTGRAHSPYTRLAKRLRSGATIDGEELVEIDIVASIPQALAVWLKREGFDNEEELHKFESDLSEDIYSVIINEHMQDVPRDGMSEKEFRDVIKREMLTFINHKQNTGFTKDVVDGKVKFYKVHKYFSARYPAIYQFIKDFKSEMSKIDQDNGHKMVGYALMEIESEVMVDIMVMDCKRMKIPMITLHDALYVPKQYGQVVKEQVEFRLKQAGWVGKVGVE